MKLLAEISEKTLGIEPTDEILERTFRFRKSARAVLFNDKDEVCLQLVGKYNYYKLPGGGVEVGETEEEALKREIVEEVGCDITLEKELGITIEFRNQLDLLHISYGYMTRVQGETREPAYEQGEIDEGYQSVWVPLEEALRLIQTKGPDAPYEAPFILEREYAFLSEAKNLLDK